MTDQERPPEPGNPPEGMTPPEPPAQPDQPAVPESDQPTIGWTAPQPPTSAPVSPGWGTSPNADTPPIPPVSDPAQPAWGAAPPPPPFAAPPPPPAQPPAGGPLLSASPSPTSGWTQPPQGAMGGQQEVAPGLVFSGTPARVAAFIVDGFLLAIVSGVVSAIFGVSAFGGRTAVTPGEIPQVQFGTGYIVATLISVVINAVYFIGFWSGGRRATLGQMLFSIQVGNAFDGKPLTTNQAVKRWFGLGEFLAAFSVSTGAAAGLGLLGLLWSLVLFLTTVSSPTKQGLHDKFANSAVVRPIGASNTLVWTCLIIVIGLVVILPLIAILGLIAIGSQVSTILSAVGESV